MDETYFGVHEDLLYARKINPVQGSPLHLPVCGIFSSCCFKLENE